MMKYIQRVFPYVVCVVLHLTGIAHVAKMILWLATPPVDEAK